MQEIRLLGEIKKEHFTSKLLLIIYNQYQIPLVCDMVQYPIGVEDNLVIVGGQKGAMASGKECYALLKVGDKASIKEELAIEKLIGISDAIICIELSQELESKIEKSYLSFVPEIYARYGESKKWVERPFLSFVNENYRKAYSRDAEGIYYYKNMVELYANRLMVEILSNSSKGLFDVLKIESNTSPEPRLTIGELLTIYNNEEEKEKEAAHLKYSILYFKEVLKEHNKKEKAEHLIFSQGAQDNNKKVLREIEKFNFSKKDLHKLEWKYTRFKRFQSLIEEEKVNEGLVREYKKQTLFDLTPETIVLELKEFYRPWIRNTLKVLKLSFNNIANRRDSKAVGEFRSKCGKITETLSLCFSQSKTIENGELLLKMKKELTEFIESHENVVQDEYFNGLRYIPYHLKYLWNNEPKIYHRVGVFVLILLLALLQSNVMIGITLVSLGLIFLAINI